MLVTQMSIYNLLSIVFCLRVLWSIIDCARPVCPLTGWREKKEPALAAGTRSRGRYSPSAEKPAESARWRQSHNNRTSNNHNLGQKTRVESTLQLRGAAAPTGPCSTT